LNVSSIHDFDALEITNYANNKKLLKKLDKDIDYRLIWVLFNVCGWECASPSYLHYSSFVLTHQSVVSNKAFEIVTKIMCNALLYYVNKYLT